MTPKTLQSQIALGEDSKRQFKVDVRNAESLAAETAAFANSEGGQMFLGVADDGSTPGLAAADVSRIKPFISPGHLPNNLTVEKIRNGNSNIRNPILVSYVAKGLLPYHGLGSGIKRALEQWPQIEFSDDHDGCLFQVTVSRKPLEELDLVQSDAPIKEPRTSNAPRNAPIKGKDAPEKVSLKGHIGHLSGQDDPINDLLNEIRKTPNADYATLARDLRVSEATVKRNIQKLKQQNRIRRVGSKKTGHWEII